MLCFFFLKRENERKSSLWYCNVLFGMLFSKMRWRVFRNFSCKNSSRFYDFLWLREKQITRDLWADACFFFPHLFIYFVKFLSHDVCWNVCFYFASEEMSVCIKTLFLLVLPLFGIGVDLFGWSVYCRQSVSLHTSACWTHFVMVHVCVNCTFCTLESSVPCYVCPKYMQNKE